MQHLRTLSLVLLAASPTLAASHLVVPGQQLGEVRIGADIDDVVKQLGTPQGGDAAMGKSTATYYGNGGKTRLDVYSERNFGHDQDRARVKQIRANSTIFATKTGDSVGDTLSQIRRHFPKLRYTGYYTQGASKVRVYDEKTRGIAFEFKYGRCIAILVHEPNRDTSLQYLPFHSNFHPR